MNLWLVMVVIGLITFATRLSFITLFARMRVPDRVRQPLRFIPPAVLTAIVFPELFLKNDQLYLSVHNERLLAGILAVLVAWRTRNVVLTIVAGMAALWLLQYLGM